MITEPWQTKDSYNGLLSFLLDQHFIGEKSASLWDQWEYDYDYLRSAGFKTRPEGDQVILSWDSATLKREAETHGWTFVDPGDVLVDCKSKDVRLGEIPEQLLIDARVLLLKMRNNNPEVE